MAVRVAVVGATGRVGLEVCRGLQKDEGFALVAAVARGVSPTDLGRSLGLAAPPAGLVTGRSLAEVIEQGARPDVVVDFARAAVTRATVATAISHGIAPVVGTTGIERDELERWAAACRKANLGGAFVANFALGAMLMLRFAGEARRFFPHVEIIEMHSQHKLDAPSGTALVTRDRLEAAHGDLKGPEVPIHSVRLPGLVAHQEVIFGGPGQVLTIRHDALSRECYVPGVLLACRWVLEQRQVAFDLESMI